MNNYVMCCGMWRVDGIDRWSERHGRLSSGAQRAPAIWRVDLLSCPSGRWLLRARNRSTRVPALFCTVIYCSASSCINPERLLRYTDAAAAPTLSFKWNCVFIYRANRAPLSLTRNRTLSAQTRRRIAGDFTALYIYSFIYIQLYVRKVL